MSLQQWIVLVERQEEIVKSLLEAVQLRDAMIEDYKDLLRRCEKMVSEHGEAIAEQNGVIGRMADLTDGLINELEILRKHVGAKRS